MHINKNTRAAIEGADLHARTDEILENTVRSFHALLNDADDPQVVLDTWGTEAAARLAANADYRKLLVNHAVLGLPQLPASFVSNTDGTVVYTAPVGG